VEQITLTAPDISCEHCQRTIERELGALPGVETVSVDIPGKLVDVAFDPERTSQEAIVARLEDEGYPVAS
jgi:copper chaperone CopZ